jgi:hypothetical protein
VVMLADNGFGGFGEPSDEAVLVTKAARVGPPRVVSARMTEITVEWNAAGGRQSNLHGYNISYRATGAAQGSAAAFVFSAGPSTRLVVGGLQPNSSYVFAVAAVNAGGVAEFSVISSPARTQGVDYLAACSLYPTVDGVAAGAPAVSGYLVLQELTLGLGSLAGNIQGLPIVGEQLDPVGGSGWAISFWQYGQSLGGTTGRAIGLMLLNTSTVTMTNTTLGSFSLAAALPLSLHGPASLVAGSLVLQLLGPSTVASAAIVVARCEIGVSRPDDSGAVNDAGPPQSAQVDGRAFCTLSGIGSTGTGLTGGFIATAWDTGTSFKLLHIQWQLCQG